MINFTWFYINWLNFFTCLTLLFIFANEFYWFLNKWPIKLQGKKLIWGNGSKQSENWLGKLNAWPNSFEATRNVNGIFWLKVRLTWNFKGFSLVIKWSSMKAPKTTPQASIDHNQRLTSCYQYHVFLHHLRKQDLGDC